MWIGKTRIPGGLCEVAIDELELFNREITHAEVQGIHDALSAGKCRCVPPPPGWSPGGHWTRSQGQAFRTSSRYQRFPTPERRSLARSGSSVSAGPVRPFTGHWLVEFPAGDGRQLPGIYQSRPIEVPTDPALEPGASGFTVDAWVIYQPDPIGGPRVIVSKMSSLAAPVSPRNPWWAIEISGHR